MFRYVLKRLLLMIPVLLGVSLIVYCICGTNTTPIIITILGEDATPEEIAETEKELGFDRPILVRYLEYMSKLVRGDLGASHRNGKQVMAIWMEKMPLTMEVAFWSVLVSVAISIPIGIGCALVRGSLLDNLGMVVALLGLSIPNFWLGLMLIILFSLNLGWLPSGGYQDGFKSMILPAITIGTGMTAALTRQTRSAMLEVIRSDYLRTARAKGVSESRVILYHALRNALIPIILTIGGQVAACLAGASLTETVFALPGLGRQIVDSINTFDVNVVTGLVTMKSMVTASILLVVDLLYALVDPRIKAQFVRGGKKHG